MSVAKVAAWRKLKVWGNVWEGEGKQIMNGLNRSYCQQMLAEVQTTRAVPIAASGPVSVELAEVRLTETVGDSARVRSFEGYPQG